MADTIVVINPNATQAVTDGIDAAMAPLRLDGGAAGVMVAPTPGLKSDDQIFGYFARVFEALGDGTPLVYQDYPQSTGVFASVALLNRPVDTFPALVMLKHEDCPGLGKLSRIRRTAEIDGRRRISILCGNGGLYLPQELARRHRLRRHPRPRPHPDGGRRGRADRPDRAPGTPAGRAGLRLISTAPALTQRPSSFDRLRVSPSC